MTDHALLAKAGRRARQAIAKVEQIYRLAVPVKLRRLFWDERVQIIVMSGSHLESARFAGDEIAAVADLSTRAGIRSARRFAKRWPTLLAIVPDSLLTTTLELPAEASGNPEAVARLNLRRWTSFGPDEAFHRVERILDHPGGGCRIRVDLVPQDAVRGALDRAKDSGVPVDGLRLPDSGVIALSGHRQRRRRVLRYLDLCLAVTVCGLTAVVVRYERDEAVQAWSDALERSRSALSDAKEAGILRVEVAELRTTYESAVATMAGRMAPFEAMKSIDAIVPRHARVESLTLEMERFELRMVIGQGERTESPDPAIIGDFEMATIADLADGRRRVLAAGRLPGPRP